MVRLCLFIYILYSEHFIGGLARQPTLTKVARCILVWSSGPEPNRLDPGGRDDSGCGSLRKLTRDSGSLRLHPSMVPVEIV